MTFKCKAYGEFTMFGDVADKLIKMMGHSGTVPGALSAEDVPAALARLKQAIESAEESEMEIPAAEENNDEEEPPISLSLRAFPLLEMLTAAARENTYVMWYEQ